MHGETLPAFQSDIGIPAECLVVMEADAARRDLVGRDLIAQRLWGCERDVFAGELTFDELRVAGDRMRPSKWITSSMMLFPLPHQRMLLQGSCRLACLSYKR